MPLITRLTGRAARLNPFKAPWGARLGKATPGLLALGLDPGATKDVLLWQLTRAEVWRKDQGIVLSRRRAALLGSNEKMKKSASVEVYTEGLTLSPHIESGIDQCGMATGCFRVCIGSETGRYKNPGMDRYRIRRTLHWHLFPEDFIHSVVNEFQRVRWEASKANLDEVAARLNVASDVQWEHVPEIMESGMPLYDYTALPRHSRRHAPDHYHLLYSLKEHVGSLDMALDWLESGRNVAIVIGNPMPVGAAEELAELQRQIRLAEFRGDSAEIKRYKSAHAKRVSRKYGIGPTGAKAAAAALLSRGKLWGFDALAGDEHDARSQDEVINPLMQEGKGAWIVLHAKGPACYDSGPFVVRVNDSGLPLQRTLEDRRAVEVPWHVLEREKKAHTALQAPTIRMAPLLPTTKDLSSIRRRLGRRDAQPVRCFDIPSPWLVDPWGNKVVTWK
jgi:hypothetical protein